MFLVQLFYKNIIPEMASVNLCDYTCIKPIHQESNIMQCELYIFSIQLRKYKFYSVMHCEFTPNAI